LRYLIVILLLLFSFGFSENQKINAIFVLKTDKEIDSSKKGVYTDAKCVYCLEKKLNCFIGQDLTQKNIADIKNEIIEFYKNNNYPFVVVTAPEQKITSGAIKFIVIESKLSDVVVKGNRNFKAKSIKKYIHTKKGEEINSSKMQRDLALINRNPFRNAQAIFKPGKQENTTDMELWVADKSPYRLYAGIDNTGIKATDVNRFFTGINFGNLWGLDHVASYQFTGSFDIHRFYSHTASYTLPLWHYHFLTAFGGYSRIKPKSDLTGIKHDGKSSQISLRYAVPLWPVGKYSHEWAVGIDYKRSNINMSFFDVPFIKNSVNISQLFGKYEGQYLFKKVRLPFYIELYWSPGQLISDQTNADFSELRYGAQSKYFYSILEFSPSFSLPKDFSIFINLRSQISSHNLISSEQYGLGGFYSVRGYAEREVNRDNAVLCNFEVRSPYLKFIRKAKDNLQFLAFIDAATGWDVKSTPNLKNLQYLIGMGPGIRYNISNYLVCRLDLGFKLHKTDIYPHAEPYKFHFSVIGSF
jgi:hemolysin activation/secretion protein